MKRRFAVGVRYSTITPLSHTVTFSALTSLSARTRHGAGRRGMQAKLAEVKAGVCCNKRALSHYNWQESVTTSIKGEVKKTTAIPGKRWA